MRECDRYGKKIQYGTLCDYCKGHCEGFSLGKSQGRADAIDEVYKIVSDFLIENDTELDFNLALQDKILDLKYKHNS